MKYVVEKDLESIVYETTRKYLEFNNKYKYTIGVTEENLLDIQEFLLNEYKISYSQDELLNFDFEEHVWTELKYCYSFAKGLKECNELIQGCYRNLVYEFCKDIAEERLEEKGLSISDELIDEEIELMVQEGVLLTEEFMKEIEYQGDLTWLFNNFDNEKVFLVIKSSI